MFNSVSDNLLRVKERIKTACLKHGRDAGDVKLVAVSKTKPIEMLSMAMKKGQRLSLIHI